MTSTALAVLDEPVHDALRARFAPYLGDSRINLVDGGTPESGFLNVPLPVPLSTAPFDCVLARHVLQRIGPVFEVVGDLHRLLKPGGHLIAITPYASSDDAWTNPAHVRAFTEHSWAFFDRRFYARQGLPSPIPYAFDVVEVRLVPYPDLVGHGVTLVGAQAELATKQRFLRNVIQEMHAILRKVEDGSS